jgi:hypothetical protein
MQTAFDRVAHLADGELRPHVIVPDEDPNLANITLLLSIAHETHDDALRELCLKAATFYLNPPMMFS